MSMGENCVASISEKEFKQLAWFVKKNFGINLGLEKKNLVVGRLSNLLAQHQFQSFSDYYNHLISDPTGNAVITFLNKITTNHTFFMREPEHFDYFGKYILPYCTANVADRDLRIWSAGCSTGEEPYTLAMIIDEYFGSEKAKWNTKILATDISTHSLETAVKGEYTEEQIENIPKAWRLTYFSKTSDQKYVIADRIRNGVVFRRFNLMEEVFPFKKKFHIIFCRNVMIYFDAQTRKELVDKFYHFTEPGGYLYTGHSETLNNLDTGYQYVMPAIYRKE